jgi:hypothetical protein
VPIAGLAILFWPLVVVGSVLLAIVSSIFVGLYGAVIVFQVATLLTIYHTSNFCVNDFVMQVLTKFITVAGEVFSKGSFVCCGHGCRV